MKRKYDPHFAGEVLAVIIEESIRGGLVARTPEGKFILLSNTHGMHGNQCWSVRLLRQNAAETSWIAEPIAQEAIDLVLLSLDSGDDLAWYYSDENLYLYLDKHKFFMHKEMWYVIKTRHAEEVAQVKDGLYDYKAAYRLDAIGTETFTRAIAFPAAVNAGDRAAVLDTLTWLRDNGLFEYTGCKNLSMEAWADWLMLPGNQLRWFGFRG